MSEQLNEYKQFIDKMVSIHAGVLPRWITGDGFPKIKQNKAINELLSTMTAEQKEVFASVVQSAREGGIHDALVVLDGYQIVTIQGVYLPRDPFDESLHYDFVSRTAGDEWPEEEEL